VTKIIGGAILCMTLFVGVPAAWQHFHPGADYTPPTVQEFEQITGHDVREPEGAKLYDLMVLAMENHTYDHDGALERLSMIAETKRQMDEFTEQMKEWGR
jgi:hypothetical protein